MAQKCILCGNDIEHYHENTHRLRIDEAHSVDICSPCIRKFMAWQQERYASLFPTKRAKKFSKGPKGE